MATVRWIPCGRWSCHTAHYIMKLRSAFYVMCQSASDLFVLFSKAAASSRRPPLLSGHGRMRIGRLISTCLCPCLFVAHTLRSCAQGLREDKEDREAGRKNSKERDNDKGISIASPRPCLLPPVGTLEVSMKLLGRRLPLGCQARPDVATPTRCPITNGDTRASQTRTRTG